MDPARKTFARERTARAGVSLVGRMNNFYIAQYFDWKVPPPSRKVRQVNAVLERMGVWSRLQPPPITGFWTNVERRMNMYHLLSAALAYGVPGQVVELGCKCGQSAVVLQTIIDSFAPERELHLYDSFEGLPEHHSKDTGTTSAQGQMAASMDDVRANFRNYGLKQPVLHRGWFDQTLPNDLPPEICFAHLDGDLYESILVSLQHVYPRLPKGAVCLIDDYSDPELQQVVREFPGVKKACDEFLLDKPEKVTLLWAGVGSHGYFRKV